MIILLSFAWNKIERSDPYQQVIRLYIEATGQPMAILCWVFILGMWLFLLNLNTDLFLKILVFFAVFFLTLCVSYLAFRIQFQPCQPALSFLAAILVSGFLLVVGIFGDKVSAYPYSFDWSEGNRLLQRGVVRELAPIRLFHAAAGLAPNPLFPASIGIPVFIQQHPLSPAMAGAPVDWDAVTLFVCHSQADPSHQPVVFVLLTLFGFLISPARSGLLSSAGRGHPGNPLVQL